MKHRKYYLDAIIAYWYNRPQPLQVCAEQALAFIQKIEQANPVLFSMWRGGANSRAAAMRNIVPLTQEGIKGLIAEKKTNQDEDYAEYSFRGGLWNAHPKDNETASVGFALGSKEEKHWSNNCKISLPSGGPQYEYYREPANRQVLIQLLEEHWHPEEIKLFFRECSED